MSLLHVNQTAWNKKTVVFVHGIGIQPPKYSEPLYQILRAQDSATADATRWHEVAYDSVNTTMEKKVLQFNNAIPKSAQNPSTQAVASDFLVDLVDYLFNQDPYNWINAIFRKELVDIVAAGQAQGVQQSDHEIFMLSHSLGTVVAYETLHAIVNDAQTLGVTSNFRIKAFFTLGCPLAFIKANQKTIPSINDRFFLRSKPIGRPVRINSFTGESESNVLDWFNLRQKFDPVASLVPLNQNTANGSLSEETSVFDAFHSGANPHAFDNYLKEYKSYLMGKIRGGPSGTV